MKTNRFWILTISLILVIFAAGALLSRRFGADSGETAVISSGGETLYEIDLAAVTDSYTLTVETASGGWNRILVEPGRISVAEASCPDRICVSQGSSCPIVCLPNRLVIRLEAGGAEIDGVTG